MRKVAPAALLEASDKIPGATQTKKIPGATKTKKIPGATQTKKIPGATKTKHPLLPLAPTPTAQSYPSEGLMADVLRSSGATTIAPNGWKASPDTNSGRRRGLASAPAVALLQQPLLHRVIATALVASHCFHSPCCIVLLQQPLLHRIVSTALVASCCCNSPCCIALLQQPLLHRIVATAVVASHCCNSPCCITLLQQQLLHPCCDKVSVIDDRALAVLPMAWDSTLAAACQHTSSAYTARRPGTEPAAMCCPSSRRYYVCAAEGLGLASDTAHRNSSAVPP